ncbi:hypothetical protein [Actinomadura sp. HBU206391]|uniref:hypothetical protein n=1 Tax=Actinomadura sp. HBU206391 TaxID=2731692 RepID=UPI0016503A5F|nr:hypothetical protein [Actinomadura sp. HBU206391]MBC6458163.1 hypothetical protein [Actinomadura sp. HBU206391]
MTGRISAGGAARLARWSATRRVGGGRGLRARLAWRRLVRACAGGDPAAQDTVRAVASSLPETDVLDLLAAAPEQPADRAAYLTLIGQAEQRRALDPDGSLLALAYRAAAPDLRERLRTTLATTADTDVIRVVVTGDQRDRIAEMSHDELDHLARRLAEHRRWDDLRRLTSDLPLAQAAAAARLVPEQERTGDAADLLSRLAAQPSERLRATVDRLPRDRCLITYRPRGICARASFAPDGSELVVMCGTYPFARSSQFDVETLRIGTGETTRRFSGKLSGSVSDCSILHLGTEIIVRLHTGIDRYRVVRILPDHQVLCRSSDLSDMQRSSSGAVMLYREGLAYADPGANRLRYEPYPGLGDKPGGMRPRELSREWCALTTLPGSGLVAFISLDDLYVIHEARKEILHTATVRDPAYADQSTFIPALFFLSPHSLALHHYKRSTGDEQLKPHTEIWEFSPQEKLHRTAEHKGAILDRWPLATWTQRPIDDAFAERMLLNGDQVLMGNDFHGRPDKDLPWLRGAAEPYVPGADPPRERDFLALSPWGGMLATAVIGGLASVYEVHSPHLPSARELLERPLLHSGPQDLRRVLELRPQIGDPAVRDALDLLASRLSERFGGEIIISDTGAVPAGGRHDIALARDQDTHQGDV